MREVFQPGIVACPGPVVHVAAEADFEHFEGLESEGREVFLVHVLVAVYANFVGAVFGGDVEEAGEGFAAR